MQSFSRMTPSRTFAERLHQAGREGKFRLRIVGMDEKCRAAIDIGLQYTHAFPGIVPAFYDDIVQLIAEKFIDHVFILAGNFKEIRQHAHRCLATCHGIGPQQLANGIGRVAMLAD